MGNACNSSANSALEDNVDENSKKIDLYLEQEKRKKILKILLLGPGESGKTTTLKQMKIIHSEGFSEDDMIAKRSIIYLNLVNGFVTVIQEANAINLPFQESLGGHVERIFRFAELIRGKDVHPLPEDVVQSMEALISSTPIQTILYTMPNSGLDDAGKYFMENLQRVAMSDYKPTVDDILRSRVATQGCVQMDFFIKENFFSVFDVGGQRSQRKKWMHIFDNVHAVLFITSIAEYTQTLREASDVNRMREALGLFGSICKNEYFKNTAIILFLNKMDLFREKIKKFPITIVFPRYKGPQTYEDCISHIEKRYLRENSNPKRHIYTHVTCATDTRQIEVVIGSVIDVVLQRTMQKMGMQ